MVTEAQQNILDTFLGLKVDRCLCWVASLKEAEAVFPLACALVNTRQCQVVMGLDSPHRIDSTGEAAPKKKKPLTPEVIMTAEVRLKQLYGEECGTVVLPGHPIRELRRYAIRNRIDLIVMGQQAIDIEREYNERVVDDAPCTILCLIVPEQLETQ